MTPRENDLYRTMRRIQSDKKLLEFSMCFSDNDASYGGIFLNRYSYIVYPNQRSYPNHYLYSLQLYLNNKGFYARAHMETISGEVLHPPEVSALQKDDDQFYFIHSKFPDHPKPIGLLLPNFASEFLLHVLNHTLVSNRDSLETKLRELDERRNSLKKDFDSVKELIIIYRKGE